MKDLLLKRKTKNLKDRAGSGNRTDFERKPGRQRRQRSSVSSRGETQKRPKAQREMSRLRPARQREAEKDLQHSCVVNLWMKEHRRAHRIG